MKRLLTTLLLVLITAMTATGVHAATLTCEQVSDSELTITQFSSSTVEIKCSASGGTVSNVQISPNGNPSNGLTITNTQSMSSSLADQTSATAKWRITGDLPNDYELSYTLSSDGTEGWSGPSTTDVSVPSAAKLTVSYVNPPSSYVNGDELNVKITNIGGTTANNVKLKLNSGSLTSYPSSIAAGASASFSWSSASGYAKKRPSVSAVEAGRSTSCV